MNEKRIEKGSSRFFEPILTDDFFLVDTNFRANYIELYIVNKYEKGKIKEGEERGNIKRDHSIQ